MIYIIEASNGYVEVWKDIPNYEGIYQVSTLGRVRSLTRDVWHGTFSYTRKGVIMSTFNTTDYDSLTLHKDGIRKIYTVHRLVAMTFLPNPDNLPDVNHKDGNKLNNRLDNLEWCTASDNVKHAIRTGLISLAQIRENGRKSIDVVAIRIKCEDTGELFESISDVSRKLGVRSIKFQIDNGVRTHNGRGWLFTKVSEEYYQAHKHDKIDRKLCEDIHNNILHRIGKQGRKIAVYCVEKDKTYKSLSEAARDNNMDYSTIRLAILEKRKAKGLTFLYLN